MVRIQGTGTTLVYHYKLSSPSGLKWGVDLINRLGLINGMVSVGPGSGIRYGFLSIVSCVV